MDKGFNYGTKFFNEFSVSGIVAKVTYGLSLLGLMMIGSGKFVEPLMNYFNQIMPSLFPALFFGIMLWL